MKRTARAAALAPAVALLLAAALAGCVGGGPEPEATDAPAVYAGPWLPEGYPAQEVPLVSDAIRYGIVYGGGDTATSYEVTAAVDGDPEAAVEERLLGAGFTQNRDGGWERSRELSWNTFVTDDWWVTASVFRVDGVWYARYQVAKRS